jgi:hypothetical protein
LWHGEIPPVEHVADPAAFAIVVLKFKILNLLRAERLTPTGSEVSVDSQSAIISGGEHDVTVRHMLRVCEEFITKITDDERALLLDDSKRKSVKDRKKLQRLRSRLSEDIVNQVGLDARRFLRHG